MSDTILGGPDVPDEKKTIAERLAKVNELEQRHTSLQKMMALAAHVNRSDQSIAGLVPTLSEPSPATTDLVKVIRIGTRRKRWTELEPGIYATTADDQCVVVKKRVRVQVEEEFRFGYPHMRTDPGWRIVGYDLNGVQDAEPPKIVPASPSPRPSWWVRLWDWLRGRARLPEARLIGSRGNRE